MARLIASDVDRPVIYLDTWALSDLAKDPDDPNYEAVRELLRNGRAALGISDLHLIEQAHPRNIGLPLMRAFLAKTPLAAAYFSEHVTVHEIQNAWCSAIGLDQNPVVVFNYEMPFLPPKVESANTYVDWALSEPSSLPRAELLAGVVADWNEKQSRKLPLRSIEEYMIWLIAKNAPPQKFRRIHSVLPSAEEIFEREGGCAGFPACQAMIESYYRILSLQGAKFKVNDLIDSTHAIYAPYAKVTVLEHRNAIHLRNRNLIYSQQITSNIQDVPRLLENQTLYLE